MQLNFRNNQPRTILLDEKFNTTDTPRLLLSDLIDTPESASSRSTSRSSRADTWR